MSHHDLIVAVSAFCIGFVAFPMFISIALFIDEAREIRGKK